MHPINGKKHTQNKKKKKTFAIKHQTKHHIFNENKPFRTKYNKILILL